MSRIWTHQGTHIQSLDTPQRVILYKQIYVHTDGLFINTGYHINTMVDEGLLAYITSNLQKGYTAQNLRNALISQGYPVAVVDEAMSYAGAYSQTAQPPQEKTHHNRTITIVAGVAFLFLIGAFASYFLFGGDINGAVTPEVRVPDSPMPNVPPLPPTTTTPSNNNNNNGNTIAPPPTTQPNNNAGNGFIPTTGTFSFTELDQEVRSLAPHYPDDAAALCTQYPSQSGKDACHSQVAILSKDHTYCTQVVNQHVRDGHCYLKFAIENVGDADMCELIQTGNFRSNCYSLFALQVVHQPSQIDHTTAYTNYAYS